VLSSMNEKFMERAVGALFESLKPGGEWLVYEHVRNGKCAVSASLQEFYQILWPKTFDGCNLNRRTGEILLKTGRWETNELVDLEEEPWTIMPHVWGRLVKSGE